MSATTQQLDGSWNDLKGRIKEAWGALTDDDLDRNEGRLEQLIGAIERKTGDTRQAIADRLQRLAHDVRYRW